MLVSCFNLFFHVDVSAIPRADVARFCAERGSVIINLKSFLRYVCLASTRRRQCFSLDLFLAGFIETGRISRAVFPSLSLISHPFCSFSSKDICQIFSSSCENLSFL